MLTETRTPRWIATVAILGGLAMPIAATAATGTLSSTSPCTASSPTSTCTTNLSWSTSGSPINCVWRVQPTPIAKVSCGGSTGNMTWSFTRTTGHTFELRSHIAFPPGNLAGYNSGTLLDTETVAAVIRANEIGGTNYFFQGLGSGSSMCDRSPWGVIKSFNATTVENQLQAIYDNGARTLRIGFHYDRNTSNYGAVLPLKYFSATDTYGVDGIYITRLGQLASIIDQIGFERVVFSVLPAGDSHVPTTGGTAGVTQLVREATDVWKQALPAFNSLQFELYLDVLSEGMPAINSPQKVVDYSKALWAAFHSDSALIPYTHRAYISTIATNAWHATYRFQRADEIYGNHFPNFYSFHMYTEGPGDDLAVFQAIEQVVQQEGFPDRPWIVAESFYNDSQSATKMRQALTQIGRNVEFLLQWPQIRGRPCSDVSVEPPLVFDAYKLEGF